VTRFLAGYDRRAVRELIDRVVAERRNALTAPEDKKVADARGTSSASSRAPPRGSPSVRLPTRCSAGCRSLRGTGDVRACPAGGGREEERDRRDPHPVQLRRDGAKEWPDAVPGVAFRAHIRRPGWPETPSASPAANRP